MGAAGAATAATVIFTKKRKIRYFVILHFRKKNANCVLKKVDASRGLCARI